MKKCTYCGKEYPDEALECVIDGQPLKSFPPEPELIVSDLNDEIKTITIKIFSSRDAANIARSNLEAHGIQCWVNTDDCGGWYSNLTAANGVRLLVRSSDAAAATALLDAQATPTEINQIETEAAVSVQPETVPLKKLSLWQILSGIVVGVILCLLYQQISNFGTKTFYYYNKSGQAYEARIYRDGQLIEFVKDRNLNGQWDEWAYYENGRLVRSEYDNNFDGKPDVYYTYSNGKVVSVERDTDFNGIPDDFSTYTNDLPQQTDIKPNGASYTITRLIYKNGVLTEVLRGGDSNGNFKEDVKYGPFFNPIPIGFNPISTNVSIAF